MPGDHAWAKSGHVSPRDLIGVPFLQRQAGSGTRRTFETALIKAGVDPGALDVVAQLGSTEAVRQAVKAGLGLGVISRLAVAEDEEQGRLRAVTVDGLDLHRRFHLVWHSGRSRSPICEAFIGYITERIEA